MSSSSTFFNEECLKEYVQKSVNAANKEMAVKVEELTTRLKQQTQREVGLLDTLRIQRNDFGSRETAFAGLKESHHAFVLSRDRKISALQLVSREDREELSRFRRKEQEILKLCQEFNSAKQTYVHAKESIPRRTREFLDEEVGPALEDLKVLHERVKVMQKDSEVRQEGSKKLLNRFENRVELLTSQTTAIKTEVGNVVRRVDGIESRTSGT